jgi:citrate lyase subunit beta/citryl-CoA lyase
VTLHAMLYVPGNSTSKLAKLRSFGDQPVILDLEDSVPLDAKAEARGLVAATLGPTTNYSVRINAYGSNLWFEDLNAIVRKGLRSVVLPKVETVESLHEVDAVIARCEHEHDLAAGKISLIGVIETALGATQLSELAYATPRLERFCFGAGDFSLDLGLTWPEPEPNPTVLAAKSQLVMISRAAGLSAPHDGAYPAYRDHEGLEREAKLAKRMGFASKHAIHPGQLQIIEQVFAPSEAELTRARRVVQAFEAAERAGSAAVGLDGELIDYPVVARARQLLDEADS